MSQVDLERGESDVDDSLVPEILGGYYTTPSAPTEAPEKRQRNELSQKKKVDVCEFFFSGELIFLLIQTKVFWDSCGVNSNKYPGCFFDI